MIAVCVIWSLANDLALVEELAHVHDHFDQCYFGHVYMMTLTDVIRCILHSRLVDIS